MASHLERRRRRLYGTKIAIAAGIIVALIGIYFIAGISGSTNRKIAECTEETTGTVIDSQSSGSRYDTTIEYTPGYEPMNVTIRTKKAYEIGTEVTVKYNPTSFTRVYIEGMSPTGKDNAVQGAVFILVGVILTAAGCFLDRARKG